MRYQFPIANQETNSVEAGLELFTVMFPPETPLLATYSVCVPPPVPMIATKLTIDASPVLIVT